jgi:hypothetical protein
LTSPGLGINVDHQRLRSVTVREATIHG